MGVAYGNGSWVAVGYSTTSTNKILYTTDPTGATGWAPVSGTIFGIGGNGYGVAYANGTWIAVGPDVDNPMVYTRDPTGATGWTRLASTIFDTKRLRTIYFSGDRWMTGQNGVGGTSLYYTTDLTGTTGWTAVNTSAYTSNIGGIANGNGCWMIGGSPSVMFQTSDSTGLTGWAPIPSPLLYVNYLIYDGTYWVAVGGGKDGNSNIAYTDDPTGRNNWVYAYGASTDNTEANAIFYNNKTWVTVGTGSTIRYATNLVPCFKEGSKILTDKGYVPIESLRSGDKVQTLKAGFVPIHAIGKRVINNRPVEKRIPEQMYVCRSKNFPEVFEDLVITGYHSILSENFENDEQIEETKKVLGKIYITDGYYRIPACIDKRAEIYEEEGDVTIYHFALEHSNYYMNYGVYANGLLVESTTKHYLLEKSGMELL
jgi:hypothetical protein